MELSFKKIKALKSKKVRDELGLFVVEGEKFVLEIPLDWTVRAYICTQERSHLLEPLRKRAECIVVTESRFATLSDTVTPQGILAICEKRHFSLEELLNTSETPFLLIGECLADPGNIGTLIRTAAAAGANGVILSKNSGDLFNPKTLRAAAGAALRIPVVEGADLTETFDGLKQKQVLVLAAHLQGTMLPYSLQLQQGCAILVGNEANGLSDDITAKADILVKLPMKEGQESLNASIAGGILLYEVVRQRIAISSS